MDGVLSAAATTLKKLELHELKTNAKNKKGWRIRLLTPAEEPQIEVNPIGYKEVIHDLEKSNRI